MKMRLMEKETQVHNVVQMLCPHAMAILSAVYVWLEEKRRRLNCLPHFSAKRVITNEETETKSGRKFMCVINSANYTPL